MSHMKVATVRQLRNEFPRLAALLANGEEVLLTRRSKPIAKLVPVKEDPSTQVDWTQSAALRLERSGSPLSAETSASLLSEARSSY